MDHGNDNPEPELPNIVDRDAKDEASGKGDSKSGDVAAPFPGLEPFQRKGVEGEDYFCEIGNNKKPEFARYLADVDTAHLARKVQAAMELSPDAGILDVVHKHFELTDDSPSRNIELTNEIYASMPEPYTDPYPPVDLEHDPDEAGSTSTEGADDAAQGAETGGGATAAPDANEASELDNRVEYALEHATMPAGPAYASRLEGESYRDVLDRLRPSEILDQRETMIACAVRKCCLSRDSLAASSNGRASDWGELYPSEKFVVLQDVENVTAHIEGRSPCRLMITEGEGPARASEAIICIDHSTVLGTNVPLADAIHALVPEQTRALLDAAAQEPDAHPEFSADQKADRRRQSDALEAPRGDEPVIRETQALAEARLRTLNGE